MMNERVIRQLEALDGNEYGAVVRATIGYLVKQRVTGAGLARRIGVDRTMAAKWFSGAHVPPPLRLAAMLDVVGEVFDAGIKDFTLQFGDLALTQAITNGPKQTWLGPLIAKANNSLVAAREGMDEVFEELLTGDLARENKLREEEIEKHLQSE